LLEQGADPNLPEDSSPNGRALFEACVRNHLDVARLLLEHGANPNTGTDSNECCLTIGRICHGDQAKPVQELLRRHGAYLPPYKMDVPQMKRAIRDGHEVVRHEEFLSNVMAKRDLKLLDLYLDSDSTVPERMQIGGGVIYPRSPILVRRLPARGLDPNRPDWLGRTFLHACAENGDRSGAAIFLDAGDDINSRDLEFKATPLATAVRSWCGEKDTKQAARRRRMVEFLLKRGAATNLPGDEPSATPLAWATRQGHDGMVELLKQHGAHECEEQSS